MSYISFLQQGSHGSGFEAYRRDHHDSDTILNIGTTNNFSGTVKKISLDDDKQEVLIDGAVKITTVADGVRKKAQKFWSRLHSASMKGFTISLIGGIAGIAGALALASSLPHLWPVALAVGVAALGLLGFALFSLYRGKGAKLQLDKWDDPAQRIQGQRMKVGKEGFYFAYQSKLKDTVVSSEELSALWYQDMDRYAAKYNDAVVATPTMIRDFMGKSPIDEAPFTYTFGEEVSEEVRTLKNLSGKFGGIKSQYDEIQEETAASKDSICREKRRALAQNDTQKELMLEPYRSLIEPKRAVLMLRRQRLETEVYEQRRLYTMPSHVAVGYDSTALVTYVDPTCLAIPGAFYDSRGFVNSRISHCEMEVRQISSELDHIDLIYSAMTAPICSLHRRNAQTIREWASGELCDIQKREDKVLLNFFEPIKAFLNEYSNRCLNEETSTIEEITEIKVDTTSSAPSLEEECTAPTFDPKWANVVGEMDWEKAVLKVTTRNDRGEESTTTNYLS